MGRFNSCHRISRRRTLFSVATLAAIAGGLTRNALASTNGGLPWDTAVQTLQDDLTGPIATAISVIAFLGAGAALVFGEELGGIARRGLFVVLGVAFIVLGNKFLAVLGLTGALI